jgi:uncharacterized protein YdcH (DUF465 family)
MNISLRKANAVQNSIKELLHNIEIKLTVEINEFEDPAQVLQQANDQLFANDARRQKLLLAYYNIRGLVGAANASSGIDVALTKAAFFDKRIVQLNSIADVQPMKSLDVIRGQVEKLKTVPETTRSIYGRENSVMTSVVAQNQIDQARKEIQNLRKQKQKLNDEILELNIKTEVPLSEDVVKTLTDEGIL